MDVSSLTTTKSPWSSRRQTIGEWLRRLPEEWRATPLEQASYFIGRGCDWTRHDFPHGSATRVAIDPREIVRTLVMSDCDSIILSHFHPGPSAQPSGTDLHATSTIAQVCRVIDVHLLDHIIISRHDIFSFSRAGLL